MKRIYQDSFPMKIDFDYLESLEVENYPAKILYKSFFSILNIPKIITLSFIHLLSSETEKKTHNKRGHISNYEQQFFKVFDEFYSLNEKRVLKRRYFRKNNVLIGGNLNVKLN